MSWIECKCGAMIKDTFDSIPYKGRIISDREYFDFLDFADKMIEAEGSDRKRLAMEFRRGLGKQIRLNDIFQCIVCGRIYIEDETGELYGFVPEGHEKCNLLDFKGSGNLKE